MCMIHRQPRGYKQTSRKWMRCHTFKTAKVAVGTWPHANYSRFIHQILPCIAFIMCSAVVCSCTRTHTQTHKWIIHNSTDTQNHAQDHISFRFDVTWCAFNVRQSLSEWIKIASFRTQSLIFDLIYLELERFSFWAKKKENKHSQTRTHTHRERKTFIFIRSMRNRKAIYRPSSINAYIYMTECFVRWMAKMRSSEFVFDFLKQKVAKSSLGHLESFHAFPSKCFSLKNLNA